MGVKVLAPGPRSPGPRSPGPRSLGPLRQAACGGGGARQAACDRRRPRQAAPSAGGSEEETRASTIWKDRLTARRTRTRTRKDGEDGGGRDEDGHDGGEDGGQRVSRLDDDGRDDDRGGSGGQRRLSLRRQGHRAHSATVGRGMSNAWQARWADVALAGGAGADFTCRTPRLGLVGDVRCARPSPWRRALTLKMMSTSLCLCDVVTPAVIRERRRGRRLHRYRGHRAARVRGGRCAGDPPLGIAAKVGAAFKLTSEC